VEGRREKLPALSLPKGGPRMVLSPPLLGFQRSKPEANAHPIHRNARRRLPLRGIISSSCPTPNAASPAAACAAPSARPTVGVATPKTASPRKKNSSAAN
jgi:hypothetical protein